jgi:hypothetical protein
MVRPPEKMEKAKHVEFKRENPDCETVQLDSLIMSEMELAWEDRKILLKLDLILYDVLISLISVYRKFL